MDYSELAKRDDLNLASYAGRPNSGHYEAKDILNDILHKIGDKKIKRVLDIGCGCGDLTGSILEHAAREKWQLSLLDNEDVLNRMEHHYASLLDQIEHEKISGAFPHHQIENNKYDLILVYSVLHYVDEPEHFIQKAFDLLDTDGLLFVGDIPNLSQKGRFLMSDFGKKFDASYKGIPIDQLPTYDSHHDFVEKNKSSPFINDNLLLSIMKVFRDKGHNSYILPQNVNLPFGRTREDLLIRKLLLSLVPFLAAFLEIWP